VSRKLAAILALDVVGYSRLMSEDEAGTLASLNELLSRIVNPAVDGHGGRIVKTMGDGVLAEFVSAVEAVSAAVVIQQAMGDPAIPELLGKPFALRIGINLGDVITQGDDIFGDGVNIATRLESMAEPGGILVSDGIRDQVVRKLEIGFVDVGSRDLKNIPNPVRAYRVSLQAASDREPAESRAVDGPQSDFGKGPLLLGGLALVVAVAMGAWLLMPESVPEMSEVAVVTATKAVIDDKTTEPRRVENPSIIVLPFDNMSENQEQEYFVDGITEDIITDLSHFSGLKVLARNASFQFKGKVVDPQELGKELQVTHLLEGSVRRAGDQLRITAQLIDTSDGYHVWAQRYDKKLEDVFAVQDEVTQNIVNALALKLTEPEQRSLEEATSGNVEAYDLLLQGLREAGIQTKENNQRAKDFYRRAIEADPKYGRGYGALAIALARDVNRGWADNPAYTRDRALEMATMAVKHSPDFPQTHWAKGFVHLFRREMDEAKAAVEKALSVAPSYADGYGLLGLIENVLGNGERALMLINKGMALNPYYTWDYLYNRGRAFYNLERYEEAADALEKTLQRNENARPARIFLTATYSALGRQGDAEWEAEQLSMQYTNISMESIKKTDNIEDPVIMSRFLDHLRQAGVPETTN
jgi:adenylate cyclase